MPDNLRDVSIVVVSVIWFVDSNKAENFVMSTEVIHEYHKTDERHIRFKIKLLRHVDS